MGRSAHLRLHHVADVRLELDEPVVDDDGRDAPVPQDHAPAWRWVALLSACVALAILAGVQAWRLGSAAGAASPLVKLSIPTPAGLTLDAQFGHSLAVSPDGTSIVVRYSRGADRQLYLRELDKTEANPIPGTEDASEPFFSPDGASLGFQMRYQLWKSPVGSEVAQPIGEWDGTGATWAPDDTIVFAPRYDGGLWRTSASSPADPVKLTDVAAEEGELGHWRPQMLPDGDSVLFTSYRNDESRIEVVSLSTHERTVVTGGVHGQYAASGHILFVRGTTLWAVPFDLDTLRTSGAEKPVLPNVSVDAPGGLAQYSLSPEGTLAYLSADVDPPRRLAWLDRNGDDSPIGDLLDRFFEPRLSPGGTHVALGIGNDQGSDVWVFNLDRQVTEQRMTDSPGTHRSPAWVDSRRLLFAFESRTWRISEKALGSRDEPEPLRNDEMGQFDEVPMGVSSDGLVIYQRGDSSMRGGVWVVPLDGDVSPRPFVDEPGSGEAEPSLSPDERWLAYVSDESEKNQVYLEAFPDGGSIQRVSVNGGTDPKWSPDGRELFFREGNRMMAVGVAADGTIDGNPAPLFERRLYGYDVAPDGRFFAILPDENAPDPHVNVVLNFFEDLKRLAPAN